MAVNSSSFSTNTAATGDPYQHPTIGQTNRDPTSQKVVNSFENFS